MGYRTRAQRADTKVRTPVALILEGSGGGHPLSQTNPEIFVGRMRYQPCNAFNQAALTLSTGCPNNGWPPFNVSLKDGHSASVSKRPPFSSPLSPGSSLGRRPRWACHSRWLHNFRQSGIVDGLVGRIPAVWTVTRGVLLSDPRLERRVVHRAVCEDLVQRRRVRRVTPAVPRRLRGHPAAQPLRCFRA